MKTYVTPLALSVFWSKLAKIKKCIEGCKKEIFHFQYATFITRPFDTFLVFETRNTQGERVNKPHFFLKLSLPVVFLCFANQTHPFFSIFSRPRPEPTQQTTPAIIPQQQRWITIMIDPSGDAHNTGRKFDDSFERSVTLSTAETLKTELESRYPDVKVILTRSPGQAMQSLQNAHFANRLDVALFLSINFYQETETKPRLYLYNFSYSDDFIVKKEDLCFCAYDQAYLYHYRTTREYGHLMHDILDSDAYRTIFECKKLSKLPFKPLIGIKSPALAIEAGILNTDWRSYIKPIVHSLQPIIEKIQQS